MKNFFLKTGLTLLCLIIGLGSAWGEEIVLTGASGFGSSYGTTAPSGFAGDGIMYNGNGTPNQWASKQVIQFRKSGSTAGYLYNTTPLTNITNIKIYLTAENPFNLYTGTTTDVENHNSTPTPTTENISYTTYISKKTGTGNTDVYVYDFQISSGQSYFKIVNGSSANYVYKIVITYNTTPTKTLSSIAVKTAPTQTTYTEGETFNPAGLVLTGTYSDTSTEDIAYADHASDFTFSPALTTVLTTNNTSVTITYGGKTTTQSITVNEAPKHTAYFYSNGSLYRYEQYAEGADIILPTGLSAINGKNFVGWVATEISGTQDNEPSFVTSPTMGNANVTYYAVYATQETGGTPEETLSQTLQYDTWTYSGSTTDKSSYRLFHSGSYVESAPFDLSKLSKVVVYGGTFGGGSYNSLTIGDGTNIWKSVTVSGSSQTGKNEYTEGKALSGTKSLRITSNSGTATGTGVRISKVEIYTLEGGTTYSGYCTTVDTSTPSISANDVNIAADATSGEIEYSITNAVTGKSLSANTTAEWISNIQVTADKVTFTTSANTATTERTADFTLTYDGATDKVVTVTQAGKQGDPEITNFIKTSTLELVVGAPDYDIRNCLNIPNDYDTSTYSITTTINGLTQKDGEYACVYPYIAFSKAGEYTVHVVAAAMPGKYAQTEGNITVTVSAPAATITTISDLFTKATEVGNTKTDIKLTFDNWVVSGVKGSNAYVTDGTNGFIIYQSDHGFTAGDVLSGTVDCKVYLYNGAADIIGLTSTTTGLTVSSSAEELTPTVISDLTTLSGVNTGALIKINNVQYDGTNFTDGTNVIKPYTSIMNTLPELTNGTYYNVTGVYVQYNGTKEIAPRTAEDVEEIQVEKYAINIDNNITNGTVTASLEEAAEGVEVTLTVTPATGYQLSTLTVTNASTSEAITVTGNKFTMPAAPVTVAATFEEKAAPGSYTYNLVTDASTLAAGDVIVLGCADKGKAAGAFDKSYFSSVDATFTSGVLSSEDVIEITLGGSAGAWTLTTSEGQITTSAAKALKLNDGTQKTWAISISDGVATITGGSYGYIQYNASSPRFCNYTSAQTAIQIYKKTNVEAKTLTSISIADYTTSFTEGDEFAFGGTVTAHYDNDETKDVTASASFTGYNMSTLDEAQTVTVSYTEGGVTQEASYTITVVSLPRYTVTIETPENGTLVVKDGETPIVSGASVKEGTTLTIEATPAEGYVFKNWQYKEEGGSWVTKHTNYDYTVESNVSFRANFEEPARYTVTFDPQAGTCEETTLEETVAGAGVTLPAAICLNKDYEFAGWATEVCKETTTMPTLYAANSTYNPTSDITLYAVYTNEGGTADNKFDKLTNLADLENGDEIVIVNNASNYVLDGNSLGGSTTQSTIADAASIYVSDASKIWTAKTSGSNEWQFENAITKIGISSLPGADKKAYLWVDGANNTWNIETSSTSNCWTIINTGEKEGGHAAIEIVFDEKYEDGDKWYAINKANPDFDEYCANRIYVKAPGAAQIYDSNPCEFLALRAIDDDKATRWATYSNDENDVEFIEGATVYSVTAENGKITLYEESDIVPAGTGILLKFNDTSVRYVTTENAGALKNTNNMLRPSSAPMNDSGYKYYKLAYEPSGSKTGLGFYYGAEDGAPFVSAAGLAYLAIPASQEIRGFSFEEALIETAISNVATEVMPSANTYDLQGRLTKANTHGLFIVNGKKIIK